MITYQRNDIVDDIVDFSSSTMAFNVAKIASARASLTISLTKSLRVAGPLMATKITLFITKKRIVTDRNICEISSELEKTRGRGGRVG